MRRACSLVLLPLLLALPGCGPRLDRFIHDRAFDEALCGATHYSRQPERDRETVAEALDAVARPRLHLATLSRAELELAYGELGDQIAAQVVLARGVAAIDEVGIDDFGLSITLVGPAGPVEQVPVTREAVAALTGERLPVAQVEHVPRRRSLVLERWQSRPALGWIAGALEASTLFLLPVTEMTGHTKTSGGYSIRTEPTQEAYLAAAPVASTLSIAAADQSHVRSEAGLETAQVWMWPRPADEGAPLSLEIEWVYAHGDCAPPGVQLRRVHSLSADVRRRAIVPLPPGASIEARIEAVFADRVQPLSP